MTGSAEIDCLMREFYASRARGELGAILRSFAVDAAFQIANANQANQVALKANGIDEFRPLLALLIKTFTLADLTIGSIEIDGARATVHWRANVRSRITGATVPTEMIDIVEVRDGHIVKFNEVCTPRQGPA